jgi:hypothetical protein
MRKLRPPPRPFIDPPMALHSLEYHAQQLTGCLPRLGEGGAPDDALEAAAYAIAAFNPRNVVESTYAEFAISFSQAAHASPDPTHAARLRKVAAENLRMLAERQSRPPRDPLPSPNTERVPNIGLGSTLDARAWGYTPWHELISDPKLRRRLTE